MQEKIKSIKAQFMAYRNGIVADTLRAAGMTCYHIIFGLNVPQIAQIAREHTPDMELAEWLWADKGVRESRLLATYLFPTGQVDLEKAKALMEEVQTQEEADMLAFRLLRHLPFMSALKEQAAGYTAKALARY